MKIQPEESYGPSITAKSFADCKCSVKKEFLRELWISNVEKKFWQLMRIWGQNM